MNNQAIVTRITTSKHPNADRLKVGHCLYETVIVGLDTEDGTLGLYFPCNTKLGKEFAEKNDLIRRKDKEGNATGGFFEENCRVRAQKFRGVVSHGFWCPLSHLKHFGDISKLKEGDIIGEFCGVEVCSKYIPKRNPRSGKSNGATSRKKLIGFPEHKDTPQLKYVLEDLKYGDELIITSKVHGTSQRVGVCMAPRELKWWEKLLIKFGVDVNTEQKIIANGTRRVVLKEDHEGGWHSNEFRKAAADRVIPFLEEYMTIYFEVVGFEEKDKLIMPKHNLKGTDYADMGEVAYTYGCTNGEFDVYIYRITYTLPNGHQIDFKWDEIVEWCANKPLKIVPEVARIKYVDHLPQRKEEFHTLDDIIDYIDQLSDGIDTIDSSHIREGVCIRWNNLKEWKVAKNKGISFKIAEGICSAPDPEDVS